MRLNNLINVHCPTGVAKFHFINISCSSEFLKFIHSNIIILYLNYIPVFIEYAIANSSLKLNSSTV